MTVEAKVRPNYSDISEEIIDVIVNESNKNHMLEANDDLEDFRDSVKKNFSGLYFPVSAYNLYEFFKETLYFDPEFCFENADFFGLLESRIRESLDKAIKEWAKSDNAPQPQFKKGDKVVIRRNYRKDEIGVVTKVREQDCTYTIYIQESPYPPSEFRQSLEYSMEHGLGRISNYEDTYPFEEKKDVVE